MSQCGDGRDRHHEKLFKDTTTRRGCQIIGLKWGANTPITSDTPLRAFHVLGSRQYPRIEDRCQ